MLQGKTRKAYIKDFLVGWNKNVKLKFRGGAIVEVETCQNSVDFIYNSTNDIIQYLFLEVVYSHGNGSIIHIRDIHVHKAPVEK